MFQPKYSITNRLLENIKRINSLVIELNNRRFSKIVLLEMAKTAREVSSYASTSIEGNPLPLTEVKRILKNAPANTRASEQEVLNYNQAIERLDQRLKKNSGSLSLKLVLKTHKLVTDKLLPKYQCGHLRQEAVVIHDPRSGRTVYLPPDVKDVSPLLIELISFAKKSQGHIDPLIISGVFHKQFVIIHPFMDGNGRVARLITKVLLAKMGLNTFNLFSFENYYNRNVSRYFQTVGVFGNYYDVAEDIDFTPWLEYFTEGIIDELLRVQKLLPSLSSSPKEQLKRHDERILSFIREHGFITDSGYSKLTKRAKSTRAADFSRLVSLKLIVRLGKGRATYYRLAHREKI